MCCVGLASNFAALRALVTEGMKGHMQLHSRNIAKIAKLPDYMIQEAADFMVSIGKINVTAA